ncbi:MAG: endonuclease III, partial [bacterium]
EIYSTGYFRQKAKALKGCSTAIMEQFGGEVPITMEEMVILPGVGRKTANLVLGISEGIPGVVVDTHVLRLSKRMGFTESKNPDRVEKDLSQLLPPERWTPFSGLLIGHGRAVCTARKARCKVCEVEDLCPRIGVE